jgi:hypothetical protein
MATVLFVYWEEFYLPPAPVLLAAGLLCVLRSSRHSGRWVTRRPRARPTRRRHAWA